MNSSMLRLPFLPVRGFCGETDALTAHRKRFLEAQDEYIAERCPPVIPDYDKYKNDIDKIISTLSLDKSTPEQDYAHACTFPRAAMAERD